LVVSRFLPVEARLVRFVTLAAPLSVAYLGLDALLARTARTPLMEATDAGNLAGFGGGATQPGASRGT